ncbi:MAG: hypothetical protein NZ902_05315 [Acidilobaceae archaeon]|nr:hypothetical protein [Acidilobaceae archaeon]MCX8165985.1 hypothetical protein [Acidilobaceae archaeon]MDW7974628.1 hypothetical protein [Sulfolobales archaeon]
MDITLYVEMDGEPIAAMLRAADRLRREYGIRVSFQVVNSDLIGLKFPTPTLEISGSLIPLPPAPEEAEERLVTEVLRAAFGERGGEDFVWLSSSTPSPDGVEGIYEF